MLEIREGKTLRTIVENAFEQQEDERKQLTDIAEKLEFLHPKYYQKLINEMLEAEKQMELFEMLPLEAKVHFLMALDNTNLESFLTCILQEKKETVFIEWLDEISKEFSESLKNKFIELLKTMKENEEVVLFCIPNGWLDEMLEATMKKNEFVFSHMSSGQAIKILLQCNEENFVVICQKLAGKDIFNYEDILIENQIAFLQRLKNFRMDVSVMFSNCELISCYKIAKLDGKKIILLDVIADMEQEMQESFLADLYDALEKKEKLDLLEMLSDENDTEKFLAKKIITVCLKKVLEHKQNLETMEKVFLEHFQTWLGCSLLNNEK